MTWSEHFMAGTIYLLSYYHHPLSKRYDSASQDSLDQKKPVEVTVVSLKSGFNNILSHILGLHKLNEDANIQIETFNKLSCAILHPACFLLFNNKTN